MKIDLNVQSKWSYGEIAPLDLVLRAAQSGITHIGLCDYNTIQGLDPLKNIAGTYGIKVIDGISFHTYDTISHQLITIRGYAFDVEQAEIQALCHPGAVLETEDVVTALTLAGGKAILANPHEIDPHGLLERLIQHGLCGIERHYPGVEDQDMAAIDGYINVYGLIVTGGSYDETHQCDGLLNGQYLCPNDVLPRLLNVKRVAVI